jgi:hypothetical protein
MGLKSFLCYYKKMLQSDTENNYDSSYGLYCSLDDSEEALLSSRTFVLPLELMSNWRQCSNISNFVANDTSLLPKSHPSLVNIISTVANELLENAVKFCDDKNKIVTLIVNSYKDFVTIETINTASLNQAKIICALIDELSSNEFENIYFDQLAKSMQSNATGSRLGFIGLINDLNLNIGLQTRRRASTHSSYEVSAKVMIDNNYIQSLALSYA